MRVAQRHVWVPVLVLVLASTALAQTPAPSQTTDNDRLLQLQSEIAERNLAQRNTLYQSLIAEDTGPMGMINRNPDLQLMGIDENGRLIVNMIENANAAITVGVDLLLPGGVSGLNLDGANGASQLAQWDGGYVLDTHQEYGGRASAGDTGGALHYHSAHVAGTMIASGVDPAAKGMSPAALLTYYDWTDDGVEMAAAASGGLRASNHSYGWGAGWSWSSSGEYWIWYGDHTVSATEEAGFGFYYSTAQGYDDIAYSAPYYLIFKSAGNDRNDGGPAAGEFYWYWNPLISDWEWIDTPRDPDGGATGYDTIGYRGNAKNIMTVGAVYDISAGYAAPGDVVMSSFSNWGPTDDGRIKPDIVANGISLYSTFETGVADYGSLSGTSMASPNACGAANLLFQHYQDSHLAPASAAMIKGLILHTANEAGPADGPDYMNGWGLMDTHEAAQIISDDAVTDNRLHQDAIYDGETHDLTFYSDGLEPIALTICWTDPAGTPPAWSLDPPDLMLVNDLDLRLERLADGTIYEPWILDPANPAAAATTGDNFRDNVERIDVAAPAAGWYRVRLTHKGSLAPFGGQAYALIQSGLRQVLHVSVTGDDANPGTASAPYANLWFASGALLGEGEIVVEAGVHSTYSVGFHDGVDVHGATGDPADVHLVGDPMSGTLIFEEGAGRLADLTIQGSPSSNIIARNGADLLVENCVVSNAGSYGVSVLDGTVDLSRCTIVGNASDGVIIWSSSTVTADRTIIAFNGGLGVASTGSTPNANLTCCDLYSNAGGDWVGTIAPQIDLDGNFSADPCFCDLGAGDFHLAGDSWALAGNHPWGCDLRVGALDVGCPDVGCAGVVPNFVPALNAQIDGRRIELSWTARDVTDPDRFRLVRRLNGELAEIPIVAIGGGFAATDAGLGSGSGTVHYSLLFHDGQAWTEVMEKSIDLDLPTLVTRLEGARPNPFNPMTEISFTLSDQQRVELAIYDVSGRRVAVLANAVFPAGPGRVTWQGTDDAGRGMPSGTYFARLVTDKSVQSVKLLLVQ